MDHYSQIIEYSTKIFTEAAIKYRKSLTDEEMHKMSFHLPEVHKAKAQMFYHDGQIAAIVYLLKDLYDDLLSILPADYVCIYYRMIEIMPETIEKMALINRYIAEGMPHDIILSLVKDKEELI